MAERLTRGEDELEPTARPDRGSGPKAGDPSLAPAETALAEPPRTETPLAETPLAETPAEAIDLADVLRGVAARLDSVLDERRSESTHESSNESSHETTLEAGRTIERRPDREGAAPAPDATSERAPESAPGPAHGASRPAEQADRDVVHPVVSTLVVRIGTDGSVLGPPRKDDHDDSSAAVESTSDATGAGTPQLEPRPEPQREAPARPAPPVQTHEAKRLGTVALTQPVAPSETPGALRPLPDAAPSAAAPFVTAHADVNIEELRSRLAQRRRAVQEAESASVAAAPQVRAAWIVVRNVLLGVALGVAIAIGMTLLG